MQNRMPLPPLTIHSIFSPSPPRLLILFSLCLLSPAICASENQFKFDGNVLELDDSNFDAAISKFDYIYVDFYAPWCGHCTHLAPELEKAAPVLAELKQPIVVAKLDAEKYKKFASKHVIDGYPTLKIFMHGVPTEYHGPRKADLLVQFLSKYVAPDVAVLTSDSAIRKFIQEAGSNFPIFIGFGLNESIIYNLAVKYKNKAWFSVAKDFSDDEVIMMTVYDFDKVPALAAIHPAYNEHSTFYGPFQEKLVEDYIKRSLLPLVLPITQDSLKLLKDDQRKVVLTIMDNEAEEKAEGLLNVLKAAASANHDLIFGYVGLKQWEDFAESFEVDKKTVLPKMVVWDDGKEEYFLVIGSESIDETDMSNQVSRFIQGYRLGHVLVQTRRTGPTLIMSFLKSQTGIIVVFFLIFVLLLVVIVVSMIKDEEPPLSVVGTRGRYEGRGRAFKPELCPTDDLKED